MKEIKTLIGLASEIGCRVPFWTQGSGGNISLKASEGGKQVLYIKPSGYRLVDCDESTWVKLSLDSFQKELQTFQKDFAKMEESDYASLVQNAVLSEGSLRPSMETGFHAVLKGKVIAHFHSLVAVLAGWHYDTHREETQSFFQEQFPKEKIAFVPPMMPGMNLMKWLIPYADYSLVFLRNHGVILDADRISWKDWLSVERKFCELFSYHQLQSYLAADTKKLKQKMAGLNLPTPWRSYFPDMAVFEAKIKPCLQVSQEREEKFYLFKAEEEKEHGDLLELWHASSLLYHSTGDGLPELNSQVQKGVIGLPSEKYRLQQRK